MTHIPEQLSSEAFRSNGHAIIDLIADYLTSAYTGSVKKVLPKTSAEALVKLWDEPIPTTPKHDAISIISSIIEQSHHLQHPHYIGHQVSIPLPLASLSELVGSILNNGSAVFEMGPVNVIIEKKLIEWLCSLVGFPTDADGIFTSGGTVGNLTALLAARQAKSGYNIWAEGVNTQKHQVLLISEMCHYSLKRAAGVMGLGENSVIPIPVDRQYALDCDAMVRIYDECRRTNKHVIALVANACSTATGSYDDLVTIGQFCNTNDIWFHVDGAHGATALLSKKYRYLCNGIELADSLVWDMHKMMQMPALITAVLFKNKSHSYESLSQKASYLFENNALEEWYNLAHRTMECTKIMMGVRLYVPLMTYGSDYFGHFYTSRVDLTRQFAHLLNECDDFHCAMIPQSNIICFQYLPKNFTGNSDILQKKIRKALLQSEQFYCVQTQLSDGFYLRCTIINPLTTIEMLTKLIDTIRHCSEQFA